MTLVLTELSHAGIAMAADSAITKLRGNRIIEVDQQEWRKLLQVPKIRAGISYWGMIGAVTRVPFPEWLQKVIDSGNYTDLNSFADHLVESLNRACHGCPLAAGQDTGIHVAGYDYLSDGERRPALIHIHNGHGHIEYQPVINETGQVTGIKPVPISEPRKLFEKHHDFPWTTKTVEENLQMLRQGYLTRNGDYSLYAIIGQSLGEAFNFINLIPGTSIPRNPNNLNSRKGFLHTTLDIMVQIYRCSNRSQIIGGTVSSLGIGPDRYIT